MATEYLANHSVTSSTNGWSWSNGLKLASTSEGGRITRDGSGEISGYVYNKLDQGNNRPLKPGVRYSLTGAQVRRNNNNETGIEISISRYQGGIFPAEEVGIQIPARALPVGVWVKIPNLTLASNYVDGDMFYGIDIDIREYSENFADNGPPNYTIKSFRVRQYGIGELITVPDPDPTFIYEKNYLDVSFGWEQTPGGSVVINHVWDFGDGTQSTEPSPYHVYQLGGTYTVKHTVKNGIQPDKTQTQTITVTAPPAPPPPPSDPPLPPPPGPLPVFNEFKDRIKLEIAETSIGPLRNMIANGTGYKGGFGWVTPTPGSKITGTNDPDGYTGYEQGLLYYGAAQQVNVWYSEPVTVPLDVYVNACWDVKYVGNYYRAKIEFLDANYAVVGGSPETGYLNSLGFTRPFNPVLVPATAVYVRLKFSAFSNTSGNTALATNWKMGFNDVMLAYAYTSAEVAGLTFVDSFYEWQNILSGSHEIKVNRHSLDIGTLEATIYDPTLDPGINSLLQPGNIVRLTCNNFDTGVQQNVYEGKITNTLVNYVGQTSIYLEAIDAVHDLAQQDRPEGVGNIDELAYLIEGAGVPWIVNGDSSQIDTATVVSHNDNATLLDQIAITRDSDLGYAWVDPNNVLRAYDSNLMPDDKTIGSYSAPLDESVYSGVEVFYDTLSCINIVTIKYLKNLKSGENSEEITYGPYRDQDSINTWGPQSATFTIHGNLSEFQIQNLANSILAANATPSIILNNMNIKAYAHEHAVRERVFLDLYDKCYVAFSKTETNNLQRVIGIEHIITPEMWDINLEFAAPNSVASPQQVPSPNTSVTTDVNTPIKLTPTMSGVSNHDIYIKRIAPGVVAVSGWLDIDDNVVGRRDTGMRIPEGLRPIGEVIVAAPIVGSSNNYRYFFKPDGQIDFEQSGGPNAPFEGITAVWFV